MDAHKCTRYTCEGCNALFESKRPKRFCTRQCNKAHLRKTGSLLTRSEYLSSRREQGLKNPESAFVCQCCGVASYRKLSGTNKSRGFVNKFCSMECRRSLADRVRTECEFLERLAKEFRTTLPKTPVAYAKREASPLPFIKAIAFEIKRLARRRYAAAKPCAICSKPVGPSYTNSKTYCSQACARQSPAYKASKRIDKHMRRSAGRGANGGERIDPIEVFKASGWRCQICNKPTPQKLRGTYHKRAPELDHVVALSKGGGHTWANVQCACRECNAWKSNKVSVGQAVLFGA